MSSTSIPVQADDEQEQPQVSQKEQQQLNQSQLAKYNNEQQEEREGEAGGGEGKGGEEGERPPGHRLTLDCNIFHGVMFGVSLACVLLVCLVFGYLSASGKIEKQIAGRWVASTCSMWACLLTLYLIYLHMIYYVNPLEQRCIIRILIMVMIYAIDSFIALLYHEQAVWIDVVRDTYEAYVIFTFFSLMMQYLGGADKVVENYWEKGTKMMEHPVPLCCLPAFTLNRRNLLWMEFCVLQYAVLNVLMSFITVIIYFSNKEFYAEGELRANNSYTYFATIRFISVTFAFTALVYFFIATNKFMEAKKPLGKFISIKIIVFFSFWQGVGLSALAHFGVIPPTSLWSSDSIATGAANFLLCVEMYLIAIAHKWFFSHEPYADEIALQVGEFGEIPWFPTCATFSDVFLCRDAYEQLSNVMGGVGSVVKEDVGKLGNTLKQGVGKIGEGAAKLVEKIASPKTGSPTNSSKNLKSGDFESNSSGTANVTPSAAAAASVAASGGDEKEVPLVSGQEET